MLKGKDKRYLRSLANQLTSIMQIGKDGVNENVINSVKDTFNTHELIKINILKTCEEEIDAVASAVVKECDCELVQKIGKTLVFYKKAKEPKIIF